MRWDTYEPVFARSGGKVAVGCTDARMTFAEILKQDGWDQEIEFTLISMMSNKERRLLVKPLASKSELNELLPYQAISGELES